MSSSPLVDRQEAKRRKMTRINSIPAVSIIPRAAATTFYTTKELELEPHFFQFKAGDDLPKRRKDFNGSTMHVPQVDRAVGSQYRDPNTRKAVYRLLPGTRTTWSTVDKKAKAIQHEIHLFQSHEHCIRDAGTTQHRGQRGGGGGRCSAVMAMAMTTDGRAAEENRNVGLLPILSPPPLDPATNRPINHCSNGVQLTPEALVSNVVGEMEHMTRQFLEPFVLMDVRNEAVLRGTVCEENADGRLVNAVSLANDPWEAAHRHDEYVGYACTYVKAYLRDDTKIAEERVECNFGRSEATDDPALYFVLPTHGIAVPLRPGDTLVYDPHVYHCLSRTSDSYYDKYIVKTWTAFMDPNIVHLLTKSPPAPDLEDDTSCVHRDETIARIGWDKHVILPEPHTVRREELLNTGGGDDDIPNSTPDETSAAIAESSPATDHGGDCRDTIPLVMVANPDDTIAASTDSPCADRRHASTSDVTAAKQSDDERRDSPSKIARKKNV